jgi:hypothetical protein
MSSKPRSGGLSLKGGLLEATVAQHDEAQAEELLEPGQGGESPAASAETFETIEGKTTRSTRTRSKKTVKTSKEARRLYLSDDVDMRLRLTALARGCSLSDVAEEILGKNLPRWDLKRVAS